MGFEYKTPNTPEEYLRDSLARFAGQTAASINQGDSIDTGTVHVSWLCNTLIGYLDCIILDGYYGKRLVDELAKMKPGDKYPWSNASQTE